MMMIGDHHNDDDDDDDEVMIVGMSPCWSGHVIGLRIILIPRVRLGWSKAEYLCGHVCWQAGVASGARAMLPPVVLQVGSLLDRVGIWSEPDRARLE